MPSYTAQDIIYRSMRTIGVLEAEESATAAQATDALDNLNDLLNEWERRGIYGAAGDLTDLADELTLDPDEYRALRLNLAVDLAVEYSAQVGPILAQMADQSLRLLEAKYSAPKEVCLDPMLVVPGGAWNITTDS